MPGECDNPKSLPSCTGIFLSWNTARLPVAGLSTWAVPAAIYTWTLSSLVHIHWPFPSCLPYRFHHTNLFRATADLIWTSPGFSSHSASLCQVVWILHATDLLPQWVFTSDIRITAHNFSCPSLIEYSGRTGRRVSVDTVVICKTKLRKTSWGSCAPHIFL